MTFEDANGLDCPHSQKKTLIRYYVSTYSETLAFGTMVVFHNEVTYKVEKIFL